MQYLLPEICFYFPILPRLASLAVSPGARGKIGSVLGFSSSQNQPEKVLPVSGAIAGPLPPRSGEKPRDAVKSE
jgi:hypothetical protein